MSFVFQNWMNGENGDDLSMEDIERSMNYARDLTNGLKTIRTYPQGVTVFGSARFTEDNFYYQKARELGQVLAKNGHPVITGGSYGIMEAANRGAFEVGGRSIGMNIKLPNEQAPNVYTTDSLTFNYFFARKVMLTFSAEAYVYFPGGFGTLDELSEILTLIQTKKIPQAPIALFGKKFWEPLDEYFRVQMEEVEKTISVGDRDLYMITDSIEEIVKMANDADTHDTSEIMAQTEGAIL